MRIALVTDYYLPTLGGVQTAVESQAELLRAEGHSVTVFCPLAADSDDPHVSRLPTSRIFRPDGYPFTWSPRAAIEVLTREFAAREIDVVHTHSEMFAALAAIRAAQQLGLPLVHTMHGRIDVYTANVLPLPALTTHLLAYLHGRHVPRDGIEVGHDSPYTRTAQARTMWRLMLAQSRASDHVIVPSAHFREKLVAQGINTPTTVLSNTLHASVRERIGDPAPRVLRQGEPLRMLWVGRLSPEKRPATFAHAARTLGSAALADMYGEGLGRRAVERIGGPVTLHGSVPQDRVLAAMRDAHVLVSTSYDFDNQPMVMLEALASGLPIVYCDPDLAEVVTPDAGALTPSPDADGLVATVRELLAEPGRISRMSEAALAARDSVFAGIAPLVQVYEAVSRS